VTRDAGGRCFMSGPVTLLVAPVVAEGRLA
jgi:hypothetical protein